MTHRTPRRSALVALVLVLVTTESPGTRVADASPGIVPITDPDLVFSIPALGQPPHLVPVHDPIFGTTVTRITGNTGEPISGPGVAGRWGADARHVYSKQQPWNADGSLLLVQNRDGGTPSRVILDGTTYLPKIGPCADDILYDYRWHPSKDLRRTMINVDRDGLELSWFDVASCVKFRSWTLPFPVDYGIGSGEGNPSNDGRFVALGDGSRMFVVDMDPRPPFAPWPNRRIGPVYTLLPCSLSVSAPGEDCEIGNLSISPSGKYVDVKFAGGSSLTQDMHRIFEVDPLTLELRPHAMDAASLRCDTFQERTDGWIYPLKHADMALDPFDNNEDVIIGGRSCPGSSLGRVVKVRLRDGAVTALTDPDGEPSVQHVSTRNLDRPGWAYVGYYRSEGKRFSDEIVAVRLDGGGYERLAHKRSESSGCYRCESHPVPSRDGSRILFASNWAENCGSGCGSSSDIKDYVVSLLAGSVVAGPPAPVSVIELAAAQPNPAVSRVSIAYVLGVDAPVSLDVVDATGRRVHGQDLGRPGPGRHEARVERGRGLPAGVYWVRLHVGATTVRRKVVFVG